jgi:hypothetical protein
MPSYRAREELRFLEKFLDVVFTKMCMGGIGRLVQSEDIIRGLEFGDGYKANLVPVSNVRTLWLACWCWYAHISIGLIGSFNARYYACKVLGELFCSLGIDLHFVGHRSCYLKMMSHAQKVHDVSPEISAIRPCSLSGGPYVRVKSMQCTIRHTLAVLLLHHSLTILLI